MFQLKIHVLVLLSFSQIVTAKIESFPNKETLLVEEDNKINENPPVYGMQYLWQWWKKVNSGDMKAITPNFNAMSSENSLLSFLQDDSTTTKDDNRRQQKTTTTNSVINAIFPTISTMNQSVTEAESSVDHDVRSLLPFDSRFRNKSPLNQHEKTIPNSANNNDTTSSRDIDDEGSSSLRFQISVPISSRLYNVTIMPTYDEETFEKALEQDTATSSSMKLQKTIQNSIHSDAKEVIMSLLQSMTTAAVSVSSNTKFQSTTHSQKTVKISFEKFFSLNDHVTTTSANYRLRRITTTSSIPNKVQLQKPVKNDDKKTANKNKVTNSGVKTKATTIRSTTKYVTKKSTTKHTTTHRSTIKQGATHSSSTKSTIRTQSSSKGDVILPSTVKNSPVSTHDYVINESSTTDDVNIESSLNDDVMNEDGTKDDTIKESSNKNGVIRPNSTQNEFTIPTSNDVLKHHITSETFNNDVLKPSPFPHVLDKDITHPLAALGYWTFAPNSTDLRRKLDLDLNSKEQEGRKVVANQYNPLTNFKHSPYFDPLRFEHGRK